MILTKEIDPRCIEYYKKALPNFSHDDQEKIRKNWIKNNVKKKKRLS